ncbi:hypothetical protein HETIRDRAFT_454145 [Heterobasidion irregulare TC 32-1]|uniref:Dipeptidyl-peptidase V n=1 Tax=Heterobasidion irregulare (strain TC 32-1) TaxID=747525 RepID=W4JX20_HETIT|nr:uncharacterized protein HETIRDRAFT_454145 [Heterobasidion irregulare TC 32-1]ETW78103.1 hypothetical protein HETIRDRAFT_454145 [Heterobasidion irregulare TC 32-1]
MASSDARVWETTVVPAHAPALIAATEKVRAPCVSPDGSRVVYEVQPFYRAARTTCALWLAEVSASALAAGASVPLTAGEWNDRGAAWLPDGRRVLFVSDRAGGAPALFAMDVDSGEIRAVFEEGADVGAGVRAFAVSPDGRRVAFASADAPGAEDVRRGKERDDARVWGGEGEGEGGRRARVRVGEVEGGTVRVLDVGRGRHVESVAWSQDGAALVYRLRAGGGAEHAAFEVALEMVALDAPARAARPVGLGSYVRSPAGATLLAATGHVLELQSYEPERLLDARTLFVHAPAGGARVGSVSPGDDVGAGARAVQRLYGVAEDAVRLVDLGGDAEAGCGYVAVEVSAGLETRIDVVRASSSGAARTVQTVFRTREDAVWFGAWDARRVAGADGRPAEFVCAVVRSSGPRHEPPNLYVCRAREGGGGEGGGVAVKLSSHLRWLADAPLIRTEVCEWTARDGTRLDGMVRFPPGYVDGQGTLLPTVLFIHGGPYRFVVNCCCVEDVEADAARGRRRDIPDYMPYFCNWREMLASAGYLVVSPNYRGSQGRGHAFAAAANGGIGALDWGDCEGMLDEVVKRGWADPDRLGVAGWSHGGSLAAWGVSKTKNRFKAAVVGAGVSNWEGMVMESASPELEIAIGQSDPWTTGGSGAVDGGTGHGFRKASPVHDLHGVTTATLILHGERDERVPVGQAIGLYRGLKRVAAPEGRERAQLVLYPREPHGFVERKHAEDVMHRVLKHFHTYM